MSRVGSSVRARLLVPGLLLQVGSWFAMLVHGTAWRGSWMSAVDQAAGTVVIAGPVLAALVANEYAARHQNSLPELVAPSVHPFRGWYQPVVALWLLAVVNLAVVVGEAAVLVLTAGPPVFARPLAILPLCTLLLAAHALVGLAIGLRLGPRLAGAVAGTVSFGLFLLAVAHLAPASFAFAGATGNLVGEAYQTSTLLRLGLVAAVSLLAVAALTVWTERWGQLRIGLSLGCLALAMVLSHDRFADPDQTYHAVQVHSICRGTAPQVCVPAEAPRSLPVAARRMHDLARPLQAIGIPLPRRWSYYWGQDDPPSGGVLGMLSNGVLSGRVRDEDLMWSLTKPAPCTRYLGGSEPVPSLDARDLLQDWIKVRNGREDTFTDTPHAWFGSPGSEEWVRTTYAQLRRCDLGAVRLPVR